MAAKDERRLIADRDRLIGEYEWMRRMMHHLDMQTERIDREMIVLEELLPDDYTFPGDPMES